MTKLVLPALAAALALAACDSAPDETATDADVAATTAGGADSTVVVPGPTATATTVVTPGATQTASSGDKVTIGPNGVSADVGDSDTRVKVNTDGNTVSVERD